MRSIDHVERGQHLKALRTRRHLTQRQVADAFGIDKASVSGWEAGGGISRDRIPQLDDLYGGSGEVLDLFGFGSPAAHSELVTRIEVLETQVADLLAGREEMVPQLAIDRRRVADIYEQLALLGHHIAGLRDRFPDDPTPHAPAVRPRRRR